MNPPPISAVSRRQLIAAGLALSAAPARGADFASPAPLAAIEARADHIVDISVCTRPFRARGPRIEAQPWAGRTIIHNYGHGGSGWSLSWGSARLAVQLALSTREKRIAVIGCGAIGLTTARAAQRAGLRVRIVCRERPPEVRSSFATGVWSPSSRICSNEFASPDFVARWEGMARHSFRMYQYLLGLPGDPVEWRESYLLSDLPFDQPAASANLPATEPDYAELDDRLDDIDPRSNPLTPAQHPFPVPHVRRYAQLVFNLPAYTKLLLDDFFREGGEIEQREFGSLRQFAALKERTIVNATGYGARALLGDESIVPVRGQIAHLLPQPEVRYGLHYRGHNLSVVSRRDGILVQAQGDNDYGNADITPDRALSLAALERLAALARPPSTSLRPR